ncbi:MAG TPA: hypothetical protein VH988_04660 [Thermoanaerobaculia bacterium]|jgi:predicted transposase YdaD|nr:hypothetical protein [Thermoanaerobaculia bacterium]
MLLETVEEWNREIREEGREKGLKEGREEGRREVLQLFLRQLEIKFGELDEHTRARASAADSQRLMEWGERLLSAERLADVFVR